MKQKNKIDWTLSGIFLAFIFCVTILQTIVEINKKKEELHQQRSDSTAVLSGFRLSDIQCLEPIEDTFILPIQRADSLAVFFERGIELCTAIGTRLEALDPSSNPSESLSFAADSLSVITGTIQKHISQINRYVTLNATHKSVARFDSLQSKVTALVQAISDNAPVPHLSSTCASVTQAFIATATSYKKPGFFNAMLLIPEHAFFYTIFNRDYFTQYEKTLKENSIAVKTSRQAMQIVRFSLFNDCGEKAIKGNNQWLFYKPGFTYVTRPYIYDKRAKEVDPEDDPVKDNVIDTIVAFKKDLARYGIDLVVVMAPSKESIYPDLLDKKIGSSAAGKVGHSLQFLQNLALRDVTCIDLYTPLAQERSRDGVCNDSLYMRTDTHWKSRGVATAAKTVAGYIKTLPWYQEQSTLKREFIIDTVTVERTGDIGEMTGLPQLYLRLFGYTPFKKEMVVCYQVSQVRRDSLGAVESKQPFRDDFQNARILVLGDSFSRIFQTDSPTGAGWISLLAYELGTPLCSIVNDGGASTLVRETLSRKKGVLTGKKLVIWEFVDRDLRFGAQGWKNIKL